MICCCCSLMVFAVSTVCCRSYCRLSADLVSFLFLTNSMGKKNEVIFQSEKGDAYSLENVYRQTQLKNSI